MADNPAIKLTNLCLSLPAISGNINILKNISLMINQSEAVSITGPSGAGKTSLIMLIAGLEKATSGKIEIMENDITNYSEENLAKFRRDNIGIIFQNFHLIPEMTAKENVAIPLEFAGFKYAEKKAIDILKKVGLGKRLDHYPSQLSGGEQQRVAMSRAFVTKPKILLADEPTGNLDEKNGNHIIDLMFELQKDHKTSLVLITHDKKLASKCKKQFHLKDGKIID